MADHQLEPFENVELGEKQDQLQVFEKAVLEHEGRGTDEDSGSAPLPANYPYKQRMRRSVYEKEKQKLQIELLKVQSWVKDSVSVSSACLKAATPQVRAVPSNALWNI